MAENQQVVAPQNPAQQADAVAEPENVIPAQQVELKNDYYGESILPYEGRNRRKKHKIINSLDSLFLLTQNQQRQLVFAHPTGNPAPKAKPPASLLHNPFDFPINLERKRKTKKDPEIKLNSKLFFLPENLGEPKRRKKAQPLINPNIFFLPNQPIKIELTKDDIKKNEKILKKENMSIKASEIKYPLGVASGDAYTVDETELFFEGQAAETENQLVAVQKEIETLQKKQADGQELSAEDNEQLQILLATYESSIEQKQNFRRIAKESKGKTLLELDEVYQDDYLKTIQIIDNLEEEIQNEQDAIKKAALENKIKELENRKEFLEGIILIIEAEIEAREKAKEEKEAADKKAKEEKEAADKKAKEDKEAKDAANKKAKEEKEAAEKEAKKEKEAADKKAKEEKEAADKKAKEAKITLLDGTVAQDLTEEEIQKEILAITGQYDTEKKMKKYFNEVQLKFNEITDDIKQKENTYRSRTDEDKPLLKEIKDLKATERKYNLAITALKTLLDNPVKPIADNDDLLAGIKVDVVEADNLSFDDDRIGLNPDRGRKKKEQIIPVDEKVEKEKTELGKQILALEQQQKLIQTQINSYVEISSADTGESREGLQKRIDAITKQRILEKSEASVEKQIDEIQKKLSALEKDEPEIEEEKIDSLENVRKALEEMRQNLSETETEEQQQSQIKLGSTFVENVKDNTDVEHLNNGTESAEFYAGVILASAANIRDGKETETIKNCLLFSMQSIVMKILDRSSTVKTLIGGEKKDEDRNHEINVYIFGFILKYCSTLKDAQKKIDFPSPKNITSLRRFNKQLKKVISKVRTTVRDDVFDGQLASGAIDPEKVKKVGELYSTKPKTATPKKASLFDGVQRDPQGPPMTINEMKAQYFATKEKPGPAKIIGPKPPAQPKPQATSPSKKDQQSAQVSEAEEPETDLDTTAPPKEANRDNSSGIDFVAELEELNVERRQAELDELAKGNKSEDFIRGVITSTSTRFDGLYEIDKKAGDVYSKAYLAGWQGHIIQYMKESVTLVRYLKTINYTTDEQKEKYIKYFIDTYCNTIPKLVKSAGIPKPKKTKTTTGYEDARGLIEVTIKRTAQSDISELAGKK